MPPSITQHMVTLRLKFIEQDLEFDDNGKIVSFKYTGKWEKSYEAEQHIHNLGHSD